MTAIDFSDLTGIKPQPKQTNAKGFYSPKEVPEEKPKGKHNAVGYPTQQTETGDELIQLFPVPILICPYPVD